MDLGFTTLLTEKNANPKLQKTSEALGYYPVMLSLAPAKTSGAKFNTCPFASPSCLAECIFNSGRGRGLKTQSARKARTLLWLNDPDKFKAMLVREGNRVYKVAKRKGLKLAFRMNGYSDIVWEKKWPELFSLLGDVTFYDYTKIPTRLMPGWKLPINYNLVFSRSEINWADCVKVLQANGRVTVIFKDGLPATYEGYPVVDGNAHDLVFLHPPGVIIGLQPRGRALKDNTGFVVTPTNVVKAW